MSDNLVDDVDIQIEQQGVATYKVNDGEVFVFTTATLEKLLEVSKRSGRAIVFVKARETV